MTTFFTADTHFGHSAILGFCNRPFNTVEEMNEGLINNWNAVVSPQDVVYHLGDFGFMSAAEMTKIINRLNGNINFVPGNHDKQLVKISRLNICAPIHELKIDHTFVVLSHYPMLSWNRSNHGSLMLHGHSHGTQQYPHAMRIHDVGVDVNGYAPVSFEVIKQKLLSIPTPKEQYAERERMTTLAEGGCNPDSDAP